jgi:hypothetical protein
MKESLPSDANYQSQKMSIPWVLKFPRADDNGYLLLQVSSYGDHPLDLNLLATEGEAPYKGKSASTLLAEILCKY